jgi:hypothetical protein
MPQRASLTGKSSLRDHWEPGMYFDAARGSMDSRPETCLHLVVDFLPKY